MKRFSTPILAFFIIGCLQLLIKKSDAQGTWIAEPSMPGFTTRATAVSFAIGNNGYIGTGYDESNSADLADFWKYNPLTRAWSQMADFGGGPRISAIGFTIGNKGYIGTGTEMTNSIFYDDFWEYDPVTNVWTQMASFGGGVRAYAFSFSIGNYGYVGTGNDGGLTFYRDIWRYSPANDSWTQMNNFGGSARSDVDRAVFVIGNNAYAGTGINSSFTALKDFWKYNWLTDTWSAMPNVPGQTRLGAVGWSICNKGFIGLGYDAGFNFYTDLYMFDPATNTFSAAAAFPSSGRDDMPSFVVNDTAYMPTGETGYLETVNDHWAYTYPCVVVPPPAANFRSSDSSFCSGNCINYTDLSTNATSWKWIFTGGAPSSATDKNPANICYYTSGSFDVMQIAYNSGGSDTLKATKLIQVFASPPTPNLTTSHDTLFCSYDPTYTAYQWYDSSVIISGATKSFYVAKHSGNYNVQVTNENGCQIAVGINIILGMMELADKDLPFTVSPNPVSDLLIIKGTMSSSPGKGKIIIFNMVGEKIIEQEIKANSFTQQVDCRPLSTGIYWLQMKNESGEWVRKFVKQ